MTAWWFTNSPLASLPSPAIRNGSGLWGRFRKSKARFPVSSMSRSEEVPKPQVVTVLLRLWLRRAAGTSLRLSSGRLFSRGEISAAFRAWKHFVRITAVVGIENAAQLAHRVEIVFGELLFHKINFLHADAVLACDTAPEFDAFLQNIVAGCDSPLHLLSLPF